MGDMADYYLESYGDSDEDFPEPKDYLYMTDDELRKATSTCKSAKLQSIRKWPSPLSPKQRYCLAAWLASCDARF